MTKISTAACPESLDFDMKLLGEDRTVNLCSEYLGKVILVVNTASKCGFTPQYEGLEKLYQNNKGKGLVVLGFPSLFLLLSSLLFECFLCFFSIPGNLSFHESQLINLIIWRIVSTTI